MKRFSFLALVAVAALAAGPTFAQPPALPSSTISVSTAVDVDNDEMEIVFRAIQEGPAPSQLNQAVLESVQKAVRSAKRTPDIEVRTGSVSTNPVWGPQGKTSNWTVQADLILTSRNFEKLSTLAGELAEHLQITQVRYSLSRQKRLAEESKLIQRLAEDFRQKAQSITTSFGFKGYEIKELNFASDTSSPSPRPTLAMASMKAGGAERTALSAEGGKSTVSLQVQGVLQHSK